MRAALAPVSPRPLFPRHCSLAHFLLSLALSLTHSLSLSFSLHALARSRFCSRALTLSSINSSCSYALTALLHACVSTCAAVLLLGVRVCRRAVDAPRAAMGNAHPKAGKSVCRAQAAGRPGPARPRSHRSARASACLRLPVHAHGRALV